MTEDDLQKIKVCPIPKEVSRPLWSIMIPTYNCADYLRKTLISVLAQDPGPEVMQIEVIDDYSTKDNPQAVVEELGQGRVSFFQQPENVGYIKNFETCLQRSQGHLIHLLHGDDYVRDGFYCKLQQAFEKNPEIGAAFCRHIYMDSQGHWLSVSHLEQFQNGILDSWIEKIASGQRIATPSIVVRRDVYEQLGGFDRRFTCAGEDWEMWVRIATCYPFWFEVEPLAVYRVKRAGSLTENASSNGKIAQDMRLATEIIESYLPKYVSASLAHQLTNEARKMCAFWALNAAEQLSITRELKAFLTQIQEVFRCSRSWQIIWSVILLMIRKASGLTWQMIKSSLLTRY